LLLLQVDSSSFPSCSDLFPSLCQAGAYPNSYSAAVNVGSPSRGVPKALYTTAELRDVVQFATSRGVRVMPEWDMPGHSSMSMGLPEVATSYCPDALDPTRPALYTFLGQFLGEMRGVFDDDYLFLGGDELSPDCFNLSPSVAAWMKAHGLNASSTQQYFWCGARQLPSLASELDNAHCIVRRSSWYRTCCSLAR
jgi:N-acetyl-beta-hexosaminidase